MRIDRYFQKDYYKHKKHKYVSREKLGGYKIVKNKKTGRKTRTYNYRYTYPKVSSSSVKPVNIQKSIMAYELKRAELAKLKNDRYLSGRPPTKAMINMEAKVKRLYDTIPPKEKLRMQYRDEVKELKNLQLFAAKASAKDRIHTMIKQQEERVLEIATHLGLYHPKSRFWFVHSNKALLDELGIQR